MNRSLTYLFVALASISARPQRLGRVYQDALKSDPIDLLAAPVSARQSETGQRVPPRPATAPHARPDRLASPADLGRFSALLINPYQVFCGRRADDASATNR